MDRIETGEFVHRKVVRQPQLRETEYKILDMRPPVEEPAEKEKEKEKVLCCCELLCFRAEIRGKSHVAVMCCGCAFAGEAEDEEEVEAQGAQGRKEEEQEAIADEGQRARRH